MLTERYTFFWMLRKGRKRTVTEALAPESQTVALHRGFHYIGTHASVILLQDGTKFFSKAVKKFESCPIDYYSLICVNDLTHICTLCDYQCIPSEGKLSNMMTHIKARHQDHLPYCDTVCQILIRTQNRLNGMRSVGRKQSQGALQKLFRLLRALHVNPSSFQLINR